MTDDCYVEYRVAEGGVWYAGVAGSEAQCRAYANDLWKQGANAVRVMRRTAEVVASKSRSQGAAKL